MNEQEREAVAKKYRPVTRYLLIEPRSKEEQTTEVQTETGLYVPTDTSKREDLATVQGVVQATGPDSDYSAGNTVVYNFFSANIFRVEVSDKTADWHLVWDEDIMACVRPETDDKPEKRVKK